LVRNLIEIATQNNLYWCAKQFVLQKEKHLATTRNGLSVRPESLIWETTGIHTDSLFAIDCSAVLTIIYDPRILFQENMYIFAMRIVVQTKAEPSSPELMLSAADIHKGSSSIVNNEI